MTTAARMDLVGGRTRLIVVATAMAAALLLAGLLSSSASAQTARAAVVGGTPVSQEQFDAQFSYQVGLLRNKNEDGFLCGGSLIAPQWVLTAAHCRDGLLLSFSPRFAVIGRSNLADENSGEVIPVLGAYQHPNWELGFNNLRGDLMLLKLAWPATKGTPIALAPTGWQQPPDGSQGIVSGWGLTSDKNKNTPLDLRTTNLTIRTLDNCRDNWDSKAISSTMLCAGGPFEASRSVCSGDSGGAITYGGQQVGIVSFGQERCRSNPYNVFTRVASYTSYIEDFMTRQLAPNTWGVPFKTRTGPKRRKLIELVNPSAEPVTIESIRVEGRAFTRRGLNTCRGVIAPGATCQVAVLANRSRQKFAGATLRVQSDSLATPVFRVLLLSRR